MSQNIHFEYEGEKYEAQFDIPAPFTGKHWTAYRIAIRDAHERNEDAITAGIHGALAVITDSKWASKERSGGGAFDMDTPLKLLYWMERRTTAYIDEQLVLPPN